MAGRITAATETQLIVDIREDLRRRRVNTGQQTLICAYQEFAAASGTLTYIPYGLTGIYLNGLRLLASEYTVNYTTGAVAYSGTFASGDTLQVDYLTTGDLVAASGAVDTGTAQNTHWQISSNRAAAASYGGGTWVAAYIDSGMTHNDVTATIITVASGEMNLGTVKPDGTQRCGIQVYGGQIQLIYGQLDSGGNYLHVDVTAASTAVPATPFTLRIALDTGNVLHGWINGTPMSSSLSVDATSALTYGASSKIAMMDTGGGVWGSFMTTDGVTVVDNFNRTDTTTAVGLQRADTGQTWDYYPPI